MLLFYAAQVPGSVLHMRGNADLLRSLDSLLRTAHKTVISEGTSVPKKSELFGLGLRHPENVRRVLKTCSRF